MNEFNNLPTPVKIGAGTLGVVTIAGVSFMLPSRTALLIFFGILLLLLVLFFVGWLLWRAVLRRKRNARISGGLGNDAKATPKGISDPAEWAKLEDLRKKFLQGVNEYRSRGKDLYKLPWYVICGPPGAGKTEAIRRCNVGFPPGMQDGMQGVGGTINMNWWFTNHAVILDTAGKMMFKDVSPGDINEWREFLTLLKKSRPNCPINGLFLAISVEDLIKDPSEKILQKAGKIAQQLDVIQRVLDVRFPVYVIVTKCDLLTGFREFFDDITDPQLQHQMVGWSNPDTLDTPFRPELIDQHLKSVSHRLRGRRLGLLRDPVPESTDRRRTDEVDAMFALPNSLTLIGPRLKRYLETIFVAGEWSAKPLFLRGIYFTSSMREGSALDEELAQAIGVPVGELPDGRGWERERSYFLRDLFMEKVFKERGLVTRATNTGRLLRRRRAILFGTGFAFMALFVLISFWGKGKLDKSVGQQASYWKAAEIPQPIVSGGKNQSKAEAKAVPGFPLTDKPKLDQFHARLRELAGTEINYSIFRLIAPKGGTIGLAQRKEAQAKVFERDVVVPLVTEARRKLAASPEAADDGARARERAALDTLIHLEAGVLQKTNQSVAFSEKEAGQFLSSLMAYVTEQDSGPVEPKLAETMSWLYSKGARANDWPPSRLGETVAGKSVIVPAFTRLMERAVNVTRSNQIDAEIFRLLRVAYTNLYVAETTLFPKISAASSGADVRSALPPYTQRFQEWDRAYAEAKKNVLKGYEFSSEQAYTNSVERNRRQATESLQQAGTILEKYPKLARVIPFKEMNLIVKEKEENVRKQLEASSVSDVAGQRALDQWCLVRTGTGPLYQTRAEVYKALTQLNPAASATVGGKFAAFTSWQAEAVNLQKQWPTVGAEMEVVRAATSNYLNGTTRSFARRMLDTYVQDASAQVSARLDYPMVRFDRQAAPMDVSQVVAKKKLLAEIEADLQAPAFASLMAWQPEVDTAVFTGTVRRLRDIAVALVSEDNTVSVCRITLRFRKGDTAEDWRSKANYAEFSGGEKPLNKRLLDEDWSLPDQPLDQIVDFKFYEDQARKDLLLNLSVRYDKWGSIQMLHTAKSDLAQTELVRRATHALTGGQSMEFELRFLNPNKLPALNKWPTKVDVTEGLKIQR